MKKRSMATNDRLIKVIEHLRLNGRKNNAPIWLDISKRLSASRNNRVSVNLSRLARYTGKDEVVAVPGKLLGAGVIGHPLTVAAFSFSSSAREKISGAGGRCISFEKLVDENPRGTCVRIMA